MPDARGPWWSRELFRGPPIWTILSVCALGFAFLAGIHFGHGRKVDAAMWLLLAAAQLGVAFYTAGSDRKRRRGR